MHFVAESITDSRQDFRRALRSISRALEPGGQLLSSFMLGSTGYTVAGATFPAVALTRDGLLDEFAEAGFDVRHVEELPEGDHALPSPALHASAVSRRKPCPTGTCSAAPGDDHEERGRRTR